jgi:DNA-binding NtrC family response regulator
MNADKVTILVVDDDENILFAFAEVFKAEGYQSIVARNGEEALGTIGAQSPDLVFMDITMPKLDGLEALKHIKTRSPHLPVILITGFGTMQTAIKAMQHGAFDYLTKPLDVQKVRSVTKAALASVHVQGVRADGHATFRADVVDRYEIVGTSAPMQDVYKLIGSISTTPNHTSVLILGESGTGKELIARAIHGNSANSREPFIPINCTVLPEALLETELFGHEKGAFTGATERKLGKFEIAQRGTIFLDEIGNLSLTLQQKLLRVLQEREYERIGGNSLVSVYARFIAATNRDLDAEVKNRNFREDLFFRLNVAAVRLPPLRERDEDIPILAEYFLSKYNGHLKKSIKGFSAEAMASLRSSTFPGNVRELENLIERAVMLTKSEFIMADALQEMAARPSRAAMELPVIDPIFSASRAHIIELFERQFIAAKLTEHHGSVSSAAKSSGMTRQNFQRLMSKYKISADAFRNPQT